MGHPELPTALFFMDGFWRGSDRITGDYYLFKYLEDLCPPLEKSPLEAQVQIPGTDLHFLSKVAPVADKTVNRLD